MTKAREAIRWLNTEPNAPKHFTKAGNEVCRETIRKALEMLDKVESGTAYYGEWLPIESAPRDGTRILVWVDKRSHLVYWSDNAPFEFFEVDKGWVLHDCEDGHYSKSLEEDEPTHWMPLPTFKESEE